MPADASISVSRRAFLTSRLARPTPQFRPPWTDEAAVAKACTGCGDCIVACPEGILARDDEGRPRVALDGGECTFCQACVTACPAPVFDLERAAPWPVVAEVTGDCLLAAGITCQLCTDICDTAALRLDPSVRPMGAIAVDTDACTGCGACLATCPSQAITLNDARQTGAPG